MSITITDPLGIQDDIVVEKAPFDENAPGDGNAHIVNPPMNLHIWQIGMSSQELVEKARNEEIPIKSLCGYVWVPKRNPDKYPACPTCIRIAGELMWSAGE